MHGVLQLLTMTDIVILIDDRVNGNAPIEWVAHMLRIQEKPGSNIVSETG
jgi:hypothetical protein